MCSSAPTWVLKAREFVTNDSRQSLLEAIKICDDPEIRTLLDSLRSKGEIDAIQATPLVTRLISQEDRMGEAHMLMILGIWPSALALWQAHRLTQKQKEVAHQACLQLMSLCRQVGFPEGEARVAVILGTYQQQREPAEAVKVLRHALSLYRYLNETESNSYREHIAATLHSLAIALERAEDLTSARETIQEAEHIYLDLARKNPQHYQVLLAGTLETKAFLLKADGELEKADHLVNSAQQLEDCSDQADLLGGEQRLGTLREKRNSHAIPEQSKELKLLKLKSERLLNEGRLREAGKGFDAVLAQIPQDLDAWHGKGVAQFQAGDFDGAIESFETAIDLDGKYFKAWAGKAITLAELGRYHEALKYFVHATELAPEDYVSWTEMGKSQIRLSRYEEALKSFNSALEANPRYQDAWYHQGLSLQKLDRHQEAVKSLDRALEIDPEYADAWNERGVSLAQMGMELMGRQDQQALVLGYNLLKNALASWGKALAINPDHSAAKGNKQQFEQLGFS